MRNLVRRFAGKQEQSDGGGALGTAFAAPLGASARARPLMIGSVDKRG